MSSPQTPILVVLAAGMGSRFGGDKQLAVLGTTGRTLLHFSVMDAYAAGVRTLVLVVRNNIISALEQQVLPHFPTDVQVQMVIQDPADLPVAGIDVSVRQKPWGTAHALWVARDFLKRQPCIVINADDYYGREAMQLLVRHFAQVDTEWAMVAFPLLKTLSSHGGVNRGICQLQAGYLSAVTEILKIEHKDQHFSGVDLCGTRVQLHATQPVSMNIWGFTPSIFSALEQALQNFLVQQPEATAECFLPAVVDGCLQQHKVRVYISSQNWFGVTYPGDLAEIVNYFEQHPFAIEPNHTSIKVDLSSAASMTTPEPCAIPNEKKHALISPEVLAAYDFPADTEIKTFGNGHINKTFLLSSSNKRLIVQQINTAIFPSAHDLVQNALKIEQHLLAKQQQGLYSLQVLQQQATVKGDYLAGVAADLRALQFIDHGSSIEVVESPAQAFAAALTFGQFVAALADFDASALVTVLPDFHNLSMRFMQLKSAIAADPKKRLAGCQALVDFCLAQQHLVAELAELCPTLPLRVCHNDTKINNMLYSHQLKRGIAAIDLDTCMPGYWMFDFGDMVRTCCSPEAEDSLNTAQVGIRSEIFAALAQGYLQGLSGVITDAERQSLLLGAKVMCLMIGIRFLTDYLNGDTYFAIQREQHNLQRAQNQILLYRDLVAKQQQLATCFE